MNEKTDIKDIQIKLDGHLFCRTVYVAIRAFYETVEQNRCQDEVWSDNSLDLLIKEYSVMCFENLIERNLKNDEVSRG